MIKTLTDSKAQSLRSGTGHSYQNDVYDRLCHGLKNMPLIDVVKPGATASALPSLLMRSSIGTFIPDIDIVVVNKVTRNPFVIISTKTSIRERLTGTFYTKRVMSDKYPGIPVILVTCDKDLEFGTLDKPRRPRIECAYENIIVYSDNPDTELGMGIKSTDDLISDILKMLL